MDQDPYKQQQNPFGAPQPPPKKSNTLLIGALVGCGCSILVLPFIAVVAIAVLIQLGKNVTSVFSSINSQMQVQQAGDGSGA